LQFEEAARHRLAAPRLSGTVRLGVVEEVASGSLPLALGRFAKVHPGVKLKVQIGVSAELIEQLIRLVVGIALALGDSRVSKAGCELIPYTCRLALSAFTIRFFRTISRGGRRAATSRHRWRFIQCFIRYDSAAVF
jgi:DNA-binding transcriptional LysR family regulator